MLTAYEVLNIRFGGLTQRTASLLFLIARNLGDGLRLFLVAIVLQKLANITLKRGMFQSDIEFNDWMDTISMNTVERRDVTIKLLNENHEPVITWQVLNAWPVKVQSSDLKADGNEVAIETMELAHEGIKISKQ
jgi:phage tail-like protein